MDPALAAAAIGVGGTVIVAVVGFWASARNTSKTLAHARESRVWDRRAAVYAKTLAAIRGRQMRRIEHEDAILKASPGIQEPLLVASEWRELEGDLLAFSSEPVIRMVQASSAAHFDAVHALRSWGESPDSESRKREADEKRRAATAADTDATDLIRAELQGRGPSVGESPPLRLPWLRG